MLRQRQRQHQKQRLSQSIQTDDSPDPVEREDLNAINEVASGNGKQTCTLTAPSNSVSSRVSPQPTNRGRGQTSFSIYCKSLLGNDDSEDSARTKKSPRTPCKKLLQLLLSNTPRQPSVSETLDLRSVRFSTGNSTPSPALPNLAARYSRRQDEHIIPGRRGRGRKSAYAAYSEITTRKGKASPAVRERRQIKRCSLLNVSADGMFHFLPQLRCCWPLSSGNKIVLASCGEEGIMPAIHELRAEQLLGFQDAGDES